MYCKWRDQLLTHGAKQFGRGDADHASKQLKREKRNCIRNWKELSEMRQLEQNTIGNLYLFDDKLRYG